MSRHLIHRLTRLEQQAQARDLPSWDAVHAALQRHKAFALASLRAAIHHQERPIRDETQAHADQALIDRWRAALGGPPDDTHGTRARLQATLKTIAARHAAAPPQARGA